MELVDVKQEKCLPSKIKPFDKIAELANSEKIAGGNPFREKNEKTTTAKINQPEKTPFKWNQTSKGSCESVQWMESHKCIVKDLNKEKIMR